MFAPVARLADTTQRVSVIGNKQKAHWQLPLLAKFLSSFLAINLNRPGNRLIKIFIAELSTGCSARSPFLPPSLLMARLLGRVLVQHACSSNNSMCHMCVLQQKQHSPATDLACNWARAHLPLPPLPSLGSLRFRHIVKSALAMPTFPALPPAPSLALHRCLLWLSSLRFASRTARRASCHPQIFHLPLSLLPLSPSPLYVLKHLSYKLSANA